MKIDSIIPKKDENSRIKNKRLSSVDKKNQQFDIVLQEAASYDFMGAIDELVIELKEEEKRFLEKQTLYELNKYKAIVKKILKKILEEGFETKSLKRFRRDKSDFIIVKEIDSKLLEIAFEITDRANKGFNLLKAIEEIRGLIFDLLY